MASDKAFLEFIVDQIENQGQVTYKSMFVEYGVFWEKKIFALVCDNKLYIKPTEGGRKYIGEVTEAPPYKGAKPSFLIEEKIENRKWLSELVRITVKELPEPRKKKKKK